MRPFGKTKFPWIIMPDLGAPIKEELGIKVETPHWGLFDRPGEYAHNLTSVIRQHVPILRMYNVAPDTVAIALRSRRLGAPLAASPTRTAPLRRKSGGKREAPQRASGDAKHRRAHKCPKGHYWSYKLNKCVKSKFG